MSDLVESHLVWSWATLLGIETAEFAELITNIRVVDMLVSDEVSLRTVLPFTNHICQVTHPRQIRCALKQDSVFSAEALTILDFVKNGDEFITDDLFGV